MRQSPEHRLEILSEALKCAVTTTSNAPPDPDGNGITNADGSFSDTYYGAAMMVVSVRVTIGHDGRFSVRR